MEINPKLVPGSVWSLASGALSTVLAVSNEALPDHLLEKFPRQVVYVNAKNEINTQAVDVFLRKREFVEVNEIIAQIMASITDPEPEEEGSDFDIDSIDLTADSKTEPSMEDLVGGAEETEEEGAIPVFFPPQVCGVDLDSAFISYAELPDGDGSRTHVIRFALSNELTIDQLKFIFNLDNGQIETFVVDSEIERVEISPSAFHGVFVEVDSAANGIAAVYLSSSLTGESLDKAIAALEVAAINTAATVLPVADVPPQTTTTPQVRVATAGAPTHVIPQIQPVAASVVVN